MTDLQTNALQLNVKKRSDELMNYFLAGYFLTGFVLAGFYSTWQIAATIGSLLMLAYYSVKKALPDSGICQYVLSAVLALFMMQFFYQMHGLSEMYFFAFAGSVILITYQNWKLQIPMLVLVLLHYITLYYLQKTGVEKIYSTQLNSISSGSFLIHIILTCSVFYICGLWAYQLNKSSEKQIIQSAEIVKLQKESLLFEERKRSEELLQNSFKDAEHARLEAEKANAAKSAFLATMSHELRTPMNGVIGITDLLDLTILTPEQRSFTETIRTCGETLLKTINDILDFSKIEAGSMELENADFELRECVEEALDMFSLKAAQTGLDLVYKVEETVPAQISGDRLRLKQVLTNLVSNAVKFTLHGEVFVGVTLTKNYGDGNIELGFTVKDTGIGIPKNKLERLFKAFSQVDSSIMREYGGTGLGLIICEKIIEQMGGSITVESEPGIGSTFLFNIKTKITQQPIHKFVQNNSNDIINKKILVIDDNETNLSILKNQLEQWQQLPTLTTSANEALSILRKDAAYDLILTDMYMPLMDGIEFSKMAKEFYPHIPIILFSSIGNETYKNHPDLFVAVLTKPVKQHLLYSHVLSVLKNNPAIKKQTYSNLQENLFSIQHNLNLRPDTGTHLYYTLVNESAVNILVAEDNYTNQKVAVKILNKLGYDPDVAENGKIALKMMEQKKYDIILMDVQMPIKDGLETTRDIRLTTGIEQPIIIAMTANAIHGDKQVCIDAGMDDYISKPFRLEDLTKMLEKWSMEVKSKNSNTISSKQQ